MARRSLFEETKPAPDINDLRREDLTLSERTNQVAAKAIENERAGMSDTRKAFEQGIAGLRAVGPSVTGLAKNLAFGDSSGDADLVRAKAIEDDAAKYSPRVNTLADVHNVGDFGEYARNAVVQNAPTIVPTAVAALLSGGSAAVVGGAARTAAKEAVKTGVKAGVARALAGVTARQGAEAGAFAASSALQAGQLSSTALDASPEDTVSGSRGRAFKATLGALGTGAIETLPVMRLLDRYGLAGKASKEIGEEALKAAAAKGESHIMSRIAKATLEQGFYEGSTEALQSVGERLTHKWINDNIEILSPEALTDYANSFVAGGLVGGLLGGPSGVKSSHLVKRTKEIERDIAKPGTTAPEDAFAPEPGKKAGAPTGETIPAGTTVPEKDVKEAPKKAKAAGTTVPEGDVVDVAATFQKAKESTLRPGTTAPESDIVEDFNRNRDRNESDVEDELDTEFKTIADSYQKGGLLFNTADNIRMASANVFTLSSLPQDVKESGLKPYEVLAASAARKNISREALTAGADFIKTGEFDKSNEPLREFLLSMPRDQRMQVIFAAQRFGEFNKEIGGEAHPKKVLNAIAPLSVDPEITNARKLQAAQELPAELEHVLSPEAIARHDRADTLDIAERRGFVPVENAKGTPRRVNLAAIMTQVRTVPTLKPLLRDDVQALTTALGVLTGKGYRIAPEAIQPGLWLGGDKHLTEEQAVKVRAGMTYNDSKFAEQRAAVPSVPPTKPQPSLPRPALDPTELRDVPGVPERDDENVLIPRTRSPLGLRVEAPVASPRPVNAAGEALAKTVDSLGRSLAGGFNNDSTVPLAQRARYVMANLEHKLKFSNTVNNPKARKVVERDLAELKSQLAAYITAKNDYDTQTAIPKEPTAQATAARKLPPSGGLQEGETIDSAAVRKNAGKDGYDVAEDDTREPSPKDQRSAAARKTEDQLAAKRASSLERLRQAGKKRRERNEGEGTSEEPVAGDIKAQEHALAQAMAKTLGIEPISVSGEARPGIVATYDPKTRNISMSNKRTGNVRLDTLLHEIGHAIIYDTWKALPEETKTEVLKAYKAWVKETRANKGTRDEVRASRGTTFISRWITSRPSGSAPYTSLDASQRKYLLSVHEFMADGLAQALGKNKQTRSVVGQFFASLAHALRKLWHGSKSDTPFDAWVAHLLKTEQMRVVNSAPTVEEQHVLAASAGSGPTTPPATTANNGPGAGRPSGLFYLLNQRDRRIMEKAFRERSTYGQIYAQASAQVQQHLDTYGQDLSVLVDVGAALWAQGKLAVGSDVRSTLRAFVNLVKTALGMKTDRQLAEQILADYKGGLIVRGKYDGNLRAYRTSNTFSQAINRTNNWVAEHLRPLFDKFATDAGMRLRESMVPQLRQLAAIIDPRTGEKTKSIGFEQDSQRRFVDYVSPFFEATKHLKDKEKRVLVRALQRGKPSNVMKLAAPYNAIRNQFDHLHAQANLHGVALAKRQNYFPVDIDREAVRKNRQEFVDLLLSNPAFAPDIYAIFDEDKIPPSKRTPLPDLADRLADIAEKSGLHGSGAVDFSAGKASPSFAPQHERLLGFFDNLATSQQKAKFAKFQTNSLDAIVVRYSKNLSKKIEFRRHFGPKGERLEQLIAQAKANGATKVQIQQAQDYVNIALGSYKAELNPTLAWGFGKLDGLFGTHLADMPIERWAHLQQVAATYQNVRLLALAAFSSFIDPLGIFARSGDVTGSLRAYKEAAKAFGKESPQYLREAAERLHVVEKVALSDALAATYGGIFDPSGVTGKINNLVFRLNGLEAITRFSRLAAVSMGHQFLLRHAKDPGPHSERFLKELGLEASDIVEDPQHPGFVKGNPKIDRALFRFVEESVLRPKPTQRPNWHSDPNFLFASQYRGYLYSFWNTIPKRMFNELEQGNKAMALAPLLPYVGVTLMAEIMREVVRHGPDGDPEREHWGPLDYLKLAFLRAGMAGPRFGVFEDARSDNAHGSTPLNSWLGPTGQQMVNISQVAFGDRNTMNTLIEAMPGEVLYASYLEDP